MIRFLQLLLMIVAINSTVHAQSKWNNSLYQTYNMNAPSDSTFFGENIDTSLFDAPLLNAAVFYQINQLRSENNLEILKHHPRLEQAAQEHSADMVAHRFISHTSTVKGKESLQQRLIKAGIKQSIFAENIILGPVFQINGSEYLPPSAHGYFTTPSGDSIIAHSYQSMAMELVKQLRESAEHSSKILDPQFTHLGVGCSLAFDGDSIDRFPIIICTQNFINAEIKPDLPQIDIDVNSAKIDNSKKKKKRRKEDNISPYGQELIAISKHKPKKIDPLPFQLSEEVKSKASKPKKQSKQLPFAPDKDFKSNGATKQKSDTNTPFGAEELAKSGTSSKRNTGTNMPFGAQELAESDHDSQRKLTSNMPFGDMALNESATTNKRQTGNAMPFAYDGNESGKKFKFTYGANAIALYRIYEPPSLKQIDFQIEALLGITPNKQQKGSNFYGIFPSVELSRGIPFSLEIGTILSDFFRLSLGAKYQPKNQIGIVGKWGPSATIAFSKPLGIFHLGIGSNAFYHEKEIKASLLISAGIRF